MLPGIKATGIETHYCSNFERCCQTVFLLETPQGFFEMDIIDEAGRVTEPATLASNVATLDELEGKIVLAGDCKQLGPIIFSDACRKAGMDKSHLERMMDTDLYRPPYDRRFITKLTANYRSLEGIIRVPNALFYENYLCCKRGDLGPLSTWSGLPKLGFPFIFHAVEGRNIQGGNSPSWFNMEEIEAVQKCVIDLLSQVEAKDIGIITPNHNNPRRSRVCLNL